MINIETDSEKNEMSILVFGGSDYQLKGQSDYRIFESKDGEIISDKYKGCKNGLVEPDYFIQNEVFPISSDILTTNFLS